MGKEKREGLGLFMDLVEDMLVPDHYEEGRGPSCSGPPVSNKSAVDEDERKTGRLTQRKVISDEYIKASKLGEENEIEYIKGFMLAEQGVIIARCTSDGRDYFVRSVFKREKLVGWTMEHPMESPSIKLSLVTYVLLLNVDDAEVGEAVFALPFDYATGQERIVTLDRKVWQRVAGRVGWERIA